MNQRKLNVFKSLKVPVRRLAICAAALAPGPLTDQLHAQGPPSMVRVDPVRLEKVQEQRMVTGELRAVRRARVASEEPGLITSVAVEIGTVVTQGQVLAQIDKSRLELDLADIEAQEQAAIAAADERRAEMNWRERDLETYRSLTQREASNPKELYDAEAQLSIARARLSVAERQIAVMRARAELLRQRVGDTTIVAPFDGVVIAKHIEQGEWIEEGAEVVELVSINPIDAWLDVPQQMAGGVIGPPRGEPRQTTISISIDSSDALIESSLLRAVPQIDSKARTFSLIARMNNLDGALVPGMSITGWVPTGASGDHLTISKDALLRNEVGSFVYAVRSGSQQAPAQAMPVQVQVLFALKERYVVRSTELAAGDLLVVEGNERLLPMAPVTPIPADSINRAEQTNRSIPADGQGLPRESGR